MLTYGPHTYWKNYSWNIYPKHSQIGIHSDFCFSLRIGENSGGKTHLILKVNWGDFIHQKWRGSTKTTTRRWERFLNQVDSNCSLSFLTFYHGKIKIKIVITNTQTIWRIFQIFFPVPFLGSKSSFGIRFWGVLSIPQTTSSSESSRSLQQRRRL